MNTVEPAFFHENILYGYEQRKNRHADKNDSKMEMTTEIYHLLMSSNQIVHNRGRALAYLGGGDKKRARAEAGFDEERARPHQYKRKQELPMHQPRQGSFTINVSEREIQETRKRFEEARLSSNPSSNHGGASKP